MHDFIYDGNNVFFLIFHHFQDFHCQNMHDLVIDLYNEPRSNVSKSFESPYISFHVMATVTYTLSVIVCDIITYELPKYRKFEYLTFKWIISISVCFLLSLVQRFRISTSSLPNPIRRKLNQT